MTTVSTLGAVTATVLLLACAEDPAPKQPDPAAADAAAADAGSACDPAGTYDFSRAQWTSEGGQYCVDNAAIRNQSATAKVYVVAKNADGTFSVTEQGAQADNPTAYTLDAAKCELSATAPQQVTNVTDMQANYGNATVDQTITIAFKIGSPTTATRTHTMDFGEAPPVTSVPCKMTGTSTGVKK